ncbi:endonuclease domain-containing protein [Candidatus Neomarinimicrobiota bacterium]
MNKEQPTTSTPFPNRKNEARVKTEYGWYTSPCLWGQLKPLAREKRHAPTPAEDRLWQRLRRRQLLGVKFRRQHTVDRFIVDFYCSTTGLVIEVDGPIHRYTAEEDAIRQAFLEYAGLRVLRFTNNRIEDNMEDVLREIESALQPDQQ